MKPVTRVGAPRWTSGAHIGKDTAAILNSIPTELAWEWRLRPPQVC